MAPRIRRRAALLALGSASFGGAAGPLAWPSVAQPSGFPSRPIRMLIPWAPGGSSEVQMRSLCDAA